MVYYPCHEAGFSALTMTLIMWHVNTGFIRQAQKQFLLYSRMNTTSIEAGNRVIHAHSRISFFQLQNRLTAICLVNFLILSLVGLLLRGYPIFSIHLPVYKNLLHAHSHFAFGGWVFPALLLLIQKFFPEICNESTYRHWRNIVLLSLSSAYGMLLSFPFQGYGFVSIVFSTLSIATGFYAGWLIRRNRCQQYFSTSWHFLQAAFLYFVLSAIGPFATGPMIAMRMTGTEIYYNAIYFYLHFQYNGFFTFIILAVIYRIIEHTRPFNNGKQVWQMMNIACLFSFSLSVLWIQPHIYVNVVGGLAAALQLSALALVFKDLKGISLAGYCISWLLKFSLLALLLKCILQLISALPMIAELAFQNRNFIIAYLHLALVGFTSIFICSFLFKWRGHYQTKLFYFGIVVFLIAFVATEVLMILQASGWLVFLPSGAYLRLMFIFSLLFPTGIAMAVVAGYKWKIYFAVQGLQH